MPLNHLLSRSQERTNSSSEDVFIALAAEKPSFNFHEEKKHKATEQLFIVFSSVLDYLTAGLTECFISSR